MPCGAPKPLFRWLAYAKQSRTTRNSLRAWPCYPCLRHCPCLACDESFCRNGLRLAGLLQCRAYRSRRNLARPAGMALAFRLAAQPIAMARRGLSLDRPPPRHAAGGLGGGTGRLSGLRRRNTLVFRRRPGPAVQRLLCLDGKHALAGPGRFLDRRGGTTHGPTESRTLATGCPADRVSIRLWK